LVYDWVFLFGEELATPPPHVLRMPDVILRHHTKLKVKYKYMYKNYIL
jgi:hypothetical protein